MICTRICTRGAWEDQAGSGFGVSRPLSRPRHAQDTTCSVVPSFVDDCVEIPHKLSTESRVSQAGGTQHRKSLSPPAPSLRRPDWPIAHPCPLKPSYDISDHITHLALHLFLQTRESVQPPPQPLAIS